MSSTPGVLHITSLTSDEKVFVKTSYIDDSVLYNISTQVITGRLNFLLGHTIHFGLLPMKHLQFDIWNENQQNTLQKKEIQAIQYINFWTTINISYSC